MSFIKEIVIKIYIFIKNEAVKVIKYGIVGLINTTITLAVIFILMEVFSVNYIVSNAAGYVLGIINSFIWNKLWVFKGHANVVVELLLFLTVFGISYLVQLGFLVLIKEVAGVDVRISQVLAMFVYTIVGFLGNRFITFNIKEIK